MSKEAKKKDLDNQMIIRVDSGQNLGQGNV